VHLKNGGFVRGEVMEVQPNVSVRLRMADGAVKEIAWVEISRIEEVAATPPPAAPAPAGSATESAPSPQAAARISQLRRERAEISDVGPAVMMIAGGLGFLIFFPAGLVMLAVGDNCDDFGNDEFGDPDCGDWSTPGAAFAIVGAVAGGVGIWGFIKALNNSSKKQTIDREIIDLKQQSFLLDARARLNGGELRLTLRF